jgi:hypothetical protein
MPVFSGSEIQGALSDFSRHKVSPGGEHISRMKRGSLMRAAHIRLALQCFEGMEYSVVRHRICLVGTIQTGCRTGPHT